MCDIKRCRQRNEVHRLVYMYVRSIAITMSLLQLATLAHAPCADKKKEKRKGHKEAPPYYRYIPSISQRGILLSTDPRGPP